MEMVHIGRALSDRGHSETPNNPRGCFNVENIRKHISLCSCLKNRHSRTKIPKPPTSDFGPDIFSDMVHYTKGQTKEIKPQENEKKAKSVPPTIREFDACYKILIIGDSGVGKTAILRCLQGQGFSQKTFTTVGMDFVKKIIDVDGARIKLEIWDTAGQERFRSMTRFQFRGTKGALLVYDVTDRESYKTLNYWLKMVDMEIDQYHKEPIPVMLLGNKADKTEVKQVPYKKGQQLSVEYLMHGFRETSAKTGTNILEAVTALTQAVAEINNPKLLDSYLDPLEREEKYQMRDAEAKKILEYQERKRRSRILLKTLSRKKSLEQVHKCCKT